MLYYIMNVTYIFSNNVINDLNIIYSVLFDNQIMSSVAFILGFFFVYVEKIITNV